MFETLGSLAIVQPVLALVALVGLPLLWTIIAGLSAKPSHGSSSSRALIGTIVAITCAVGTLGLAIIMAARLALLPRGCILVQHVAQLARLGQLDLAFDLALDPRSVTFAIVVAIIACASALHTAWSTRPNTASTLAWTGLATAGAMLLCVGDGFAPILIGLGVLSLGAWGLSCGVETTPSTTMLAGNVAVLLGLVFLFWSLGGAFGPEGYDPDGAPRFVLVTTPSKVESAKATLTMTTHAGALVSSDDADLPGEPVAAPFSIVVEPGIYTLRVQGGAGSGDVVVPRVAFVPGRSHVLTPYGPTASLRILDDQIAVPRLAPTGGNAGVRAVLQSRTIGGLRASAIVLLLVLGGALAHVHALASRRGPMALGLGLVAVPAPYLALRLAPLVDPRGADGALVVVLGAASALLLAANAACVEDGHRALRGVLAAATSLALVAVGFGEPASALILACSTIVATSAALAAIDARRDIRWLGVACAAAVGLFPGAGASTGYISAMTTALGSAVASNPAWTVFAAAAAGAIVVAATLSSLAAFRVYDAVIRASVREPGLSRGQGAVVIALAIIALVGGTMLGAGTTSFGGTVIPLARRFVGAPEAAVAPKLMAGAALLASLASAAGGAVLARRVSASEAAPAWLLALGRPYTMITSGIATFGSCARFLERSAHALDRDVVDDVPAAIRDVVLRLTGLTPSRPGASVESQGSSPLARSRTLVLFVLALILTLVVFSSFVLR
jgi:hypothetical protein